MEDQYGISDLRHFISRAAPPYPYPPPHPADIFYNGPRGPPTGVVASGYDVAAASVPTSSIMGHHVAHHQQQHQHDQQFNSESTTTTTNTNCGGGVYDGGDGGAARWPRQETLTLLEVRSRLDFKFKEANQKGPLWDEVARIMSEEHGYQRSGKKCREKFENLYKYYKKTKEGKAGRQDGKHYRFFRQLEALYGDNSVTHHQTQTSINPSHFTTNNNPPSSSGQQPSGSISTSSDFDTSSTDESNGSNKRRREKKRRSWKAKIKDFIDVQMSKIMEKQEVWLERVMNTLEERERERRVREEDWRKQEEERVTKEHKFWAEQRAYIEARDSALMKALDKFATQWPEPEITRLVQLRSGMESRFNQCGFSEDVLWEDIAAKMAYFGYDRSASVYKEKWDSINKYFLQEKSNGYQLRKRRENNNYGLASNLNEGVGGLYVNHHVNNEGSSSPSSHNSNLNVNVGNVMNDNCLRFFLGDHGESLGWETNYHAMKLNKGEQG